MGYLFLALALTLNAAANILLKIGATRLGGLEDPASSGGLLELLPFWPACSCSR